MPLSYQSLSEQLLEAHYTDLKGIFVHKLEQLDMSGMILDLNAIPSDLKTAVIKWLVKVNLPRIEKGLEPIITKSIVLQCPVWKIIKPPLKKIEMSKEGLFNKPTLKTIGQKSKIKGINK